MKKSSYEKGVDYDEVRTITTFAQVDAVMEEFRDAYRSDPRTAQENFTVEPMDTWPVPSLDRREWFIGWLLKKPDGTRVWARICFLDLLQEAYRVRDEKAYD